MKKTPKEINQRHIPRKFGTFDDDDNDDDDVYSPVLLYTLNSKRHLRISKKTLSEIKL